MQGSGGEESDQRDDWEAHNSELKLEARIETYELIFVNAQIRVDATLAK
jgi:hypothetical protein